MKVRSGLLIGLVSLFTIVFGVLTLVFVEQNHKDNTVLSDSQRLFISVSAGIVAGAQLLMMGGIAYAVRLTRRETKRRRAMGYEGTTL